MLLRNLISLKDTHFQCAHVYLSLGTDHQKNPEGVQKIVCAGIFFPDRLFSAGIFFYPTGIFFFLYHGLPGIFFLYHDLQSNNYWSIWIMFHFFLLSDNFWYKYNNNKILLYSLRVLLYFLKIPRNNLEIFQKQ